MRLTSALLAWAIACSLVIAAPQAPNTFSRASDSLRRAVESRATPSIVAAAGRDGRIVWSEAAGVANRALRKAATPRTPYLVASVTKPFTATAIMILSERGQLTLDEPITRYLEPIERPGVGIPSAVTVRRTLGHVAGFPVHFQYFYDDQPTRPASFAETMKCYGAEIQPAGSRYTYSNLGFEVLRRAVERVSGRGFEDFLAREVFAPLKLEDSVFMDRPDPSADVAVRHGTSGEPLPVYVNDHAGASNVYASAEDLVRFGLFHAGARLPDQRDILTSESRTAMQQPGLGGYGLGWSVSNWRSRRVAWHSGAMPGSSAVLWIVPSEKIAIAVIANQIGAPVNQIAGEILTGMFGPSGPAAARPSDEAPSSGAPPPPASPDLRGRWQGTLSTCPRAEALILDVSDQNEVIVTLNGLAAERVQAASVVNGRLSGSVVSTRTGAFTYRFNLRAEGDRLRGLVTRTVSLGPRGNSSVTLWAELTRAR